jgi:hypothetical protein
MENTNQKSGKTMMIVALILLLISAVLNIYQYSHGESVRTELQSKIDTIYIKSNEIQKNLDITSADLSKYKGISDSLDKVVDEKQAELSKDEENIKQLRLAVKGDKSKIKALETAIQDYQNKMNDVMDQIDALVIENTKLKGENASLTTEVSNLNVTKTNLESKVNTASVLKVEYVKVKAFKKKVIGDGYTETSMARKATKLNVCFTVLDNKVAQAGDKTVYVRVISPDNKVLGDKSRGSGTFNLVENAQETMYTLSVPMKYNNDKQNLCVDWTEDKKMFVEGTYTVEVYVDKILSSSSKFALK